MSIRLFHFFPEKYDRKRCENHGIGSDPKKVGENIRKIPVKRCGDRFFRVNKGQNVAYLFENSADKPDIEPYSRKPCRKVYYDGGKSADRLFRYKTAETKPY